MRALPAEWAPLPPSKLAALLALYDQGADGRVDWYRPGRVDWYGLGPVDWYYPRFT